ncbi:MAG: MFS transporter [Acidiferrobacter sp.]
MALGSFEGASVQAIFPYVGGGLSTSGYRALWTLTYFVVHWSLGIALMPWSARRFGRRRLFQGAVMLAMSGSLLGALTGNLWLMLISRGMEGLGAGLLVPLSQSLFLASTPQRRHGLVTIFWSNAMLLPFFIGPAAGGWLAVTVGFPWIFGLTVPLWLMAAWLGARGIAPEPPLASPAPPFDGRGFALLYAGLMSLQVVLDQGEQHGWWYSPFIREASAAAVVCLYLFGWYELRAPHPLLDFRYLARRNYTLGLLLLSLGWALFMGWASLLPLWAEEDLGYNGLWGGILLIPVGLGALPLSMVLDQLRGLFGLRRLASLSFLLLGVAYGTLSVHPGSSLSDLFWPLVVLGLGVGILFVPLTMIVMSEIAVAAVPQAATTANFLRVFSANLGVSVLAVFWLRGAAQAGNALTGELSRYGEPTTLPLGTLQGILSVEAHTLSLDNLLRVSMWLCLAGALVAWFFLIPPRTLAKPSAQGYVEETENEALGS